MKLSKTGLIELFQNENMNIQHLKAMDRKILSKILIPTNKSNLDGFQNISEIFDFDYNNIEYKEVKKVISYCNNKNIKIITPFNKDIPHIFKKLKPEARDLIFIKGHIIDQDIKSYSICGSRTPTEDAIIKTQIIAEYMARNGFTLINGFARGIDTEAYLGAEKSHGRYIGVLGSGIENVYPPENDKFISSIVKNGAIISQKLIWNRVDDVSLQIRNRLSAQLTLGSIFIEGNYKSGTKWQLKFANELKKPLFYLEPKNWDHENAHIVKLVKESGGIEIKNDLSNLESIYKIFLKTYEIN